MIINSKRLWLISMQIDWRDKWVGGWLIFKVDLKTNEIDIHELNIRFACIRLWIYLPEAFSSIDFLPMNAKWWNVRFKFLVKSKNLLCFDRFASICILFKCLLSLPCCLFLSFAWKKKHTKIQSRLRYHFSVK